MQHELRPGVSVDVGYFYRTFVNFSVLDNRNLSPDDFATYTLFVPEGPEFPNGGGYAITGFTDQDLDTRSRPENLEARGSETFLTYQTGNRVGFYVRCCMDRQLSPA